MITIKPHHFIDIIKLYGAGYQRFTPDKTHGHAFYRVGNEILKNCRTALRFTLDCDDVCVPCKSRNGKTCMDSVDGLGNYTSKDVYNKALDQKIADECGLDFSRTYTAMEYCELLYRRKDLIFRVWALESPEKVKLRYDLFCKGCEQYLKA